MSEPTPLGVRRRGRPYRLPADPTPTHEAVPSVNHRVAWLLGVSRIHAADPDLAQRSTFMEHLQQRGVVVDATRMSRWESGKVKVSPAVIDAYEHTLGLGRGRLSNVANTLAFDGTGPAKSKPPTDPMQIHQLLDDYFERIFGDGADGQTWVRLASLLTAHPHLYLLPETWTNVGQRLGSELARSTGCAYVQRTEALRILVAHPLSRRYAVRAIGTVVTNPAATFVQHPLALLAEVDDPKVTQLLVKTLASGPGYARSGAASALSRRLLQGRPTPGDVEHLAAAAIGMLRRGSTMLHRLDALTIYTALPSSAQSLFSRAGLDQETRSLLDQSRLHRDLYPPEITASTSSRIAQVAQDTTPIPYVVEQDQMLHRLVREALFHVGHDRRQHAAMLLAASPYRNALVTPMLALAKQSDETTAILTLAALHHLVDDSHRDVLLRIGLSDDRLSVRVAALAALVQVVGPLTDEESKRLVTTLTDDPRQVVANQAVLHALGVGRGADLSAIAGTDGPHAAGAQWWLDNPPILDEGA